MITVRKANQRGATKIDWLESYHTFSFGDYFDPKETGFSVLRVINDDRIAPAKGFGTHPHRDMEIITYVLEGAVAHRDSIGTQTVIPAGDLQRMTAGTGIQHSEFNPSSSEPLHLLQIWILPERPGLQPGYEQKTISGKSKHGLKLVASHEGGDGALKVNQDVKLYAGTIRDGESIRKELSPGRNAYLHVARGNVNVNGKSFGEGDGAKIANEPYLTFEAPDEAEVLLFDLP